MILHVERLCGSEMRSSTESLGMWGLLNPCNQESARIPLFASASTTLTQGKEIDRLAREFPRHLGSGMIDTDEINCAIRM